MEGFCVTCSAKDRRMETLGGSGNYMILHLLCSNNEISSVLTTDNEICWECSAQMNNFRKFQNKAISSLYSLKEYYESQFTTKPRPQTSLTKKEVYNYSIVDDGQSIDKAEDSTTMITIKIETESEKYMKNNVTVKDEDQYEDGNDFCEIFTEEIQSKNDIDGEVDSEATLTADEFEDEVKKVEREVSEERVRTRSKRKVTFEGVKKRSKNLKKYRKTIRKRSSSLRTRFQPPQNKMADSDDEDLKPLRPIVTSLNPSWTMETMTDSKLFIFLRGERKKEVFVDRPYKCESCILSFWCENDLVKHNEKLHCEAAGKYICDLCKCHFETSAKLKEHRLLHYVLYKCSKCTFHTQLISRMTRHFDNIHMSDGYGCKFCNLTFESYSKRRTHYEVVHKKIFKCRTCGDTFDSKSNYHKHYKKHKNPDQPIECPKCNKLYKSTTRLKAHMRSVHVEKTEVYCKICDKFYRDMTVYKAHLNYNSKHITPEMMKYQCEHCAKKFISERCVIRHVKSVHLKKGDFKCDRCEKAYSTQSGLSHHIAVIHDRTFVQPRNKICDLCGRGFPSASILKSHMTTHTGEKPFQCDLCPFRTGHKSALYTHNKLVHEKVKRVWPKKKKNIE